MRLTCLCLILSLCVLRLPAQEPTPKVAPPWGVGILVGTETENRDNIYGSNYGAELTWQFLREHWIQGRVRATYIHVNKGSGSTSPYVYPPAEGNFLGASCDWIFGFTKPHGPYLLLGTGVGNHDIRIDPSSGTAAHSESGAFFSGAWGLGYLLQGGIELEVRQDAMVVGISIFGGRTDDAICTSLVVRKRF